MKYEQLLLPGFEEEPEKRKVREMCFVCARCHREFSLVLEDGVFFGINPKCVHCGSPKTMRF